MSIDLVILTASTTASAVLALVVFVRNPHLRVNRVFALLAGAIVLWSISNYLADHGPANLSLFFTRLTFAWGTVLGYAAYLLGSTFPNPLRPRFKWLRWCMPVFFGLTAVLSFTPYIAASAVQISTGATLQVGSLYVIYLVFVAAALTGFIDGLLRQYKKAVSVTERTQVRLVLTGIVLYATFAVTANLLLPIIVDNWTSSRFGPVFALFAVAIIGYAIVRHRLLDIRWIVVRSLGYIGALFVIAGVYGFVVFGLARAVFHFDMSGFAQFALSLVMALSAVSFPTVKRWFDRTANRLFYRDAYDPQDFFNEFNEALVSTIDLQALLKSTLAIIDKNFKTEFSAVVVRPAGSEVGHVIGSTGDLTDGQKLHAGTLDRLFARRGDTVVTTDGVTAPDEVISFLRKHGIAIVARLGEEQGNAKDNWGYFVAGVKKSGDPYTLQDIRTTAAMSNGLSVAIQNALRFDEIQAFNATLQEKVADATKQLRHSNDKLRMLDQTKDDFISMASHQLRTPLTSVKGYVSMVLDGDGGDLTPMQRKLLNQAFISAQRMVYLISDLLNVSRLRTGKFLIEAVPTNLATIVHDEVEQLIETAKGRNLQLIYHKPEHFPTLLLDETKLRQVVMNFIDNAIYYTPSGGEIEVKLAETPLSIEFTVTDSGIGVPKAEQHHLFSKFFRAPNARRARPDGTGLGLFMAKKVVIAQGGAVIFKSVEGKGSTFGFSFAKAKLLPAADKRT